MVKVVIIEKQGTINTSSVKKFSKETLYKKCGFRKNTDFTRQAKWKFGNNKYVELYAKKSGRAGSENKYELPPPIDKDLFFGKMILVLYSGDELTNENVSDFTKNDWDTFYEKLLGGFDDLTKEETSSEEELIPEEFKTKDGYSKEDGFVVDEDEEEENDDDYVLEEQTDTDTDEEFEEDTTLGSDVCDEENSEEEEDEDEDEEEDEGDHIGSELSEEEYD